MGLLSISFDPAHDDAARLASYASRMHMDRAAWNVVTLSSVADRARLLDSFGIMVIPAPLGEFEHNEALHIVDSRGRLVQIMDFYAPGRALDRALRTSK